MKCIGLKWNYVADTCALGPAIWLRWFELYRGQVWDDEWKSRGIEQPGGSWGFSGSNKREPELEVLEYLTREFPNSIWFDDRSTPGRETRTDIARRSFELAISSLKEQFGEGLDKWRWGNINQLQVRSLTQMPELSRNGGPTVGTEFTVIGLCTSLNPRRFCSSILWRELPGATVGCGQLSEVHRPIRLIRAATSARSAAAHLGG